MCSVVPAGRQFEWLAAGLCFVRNRTHRTVTASIFNVFSARDERHLALVALDRLALCFAVVRQACVVQVVTLEASCALDAPFSAAARLFFGGILTVLAAHGQAGADRPPG